MRRSYLGSEMLTVERGKGKRSMLVIPVGVWGEVAALLGLAGLLVVRVVGDEDLAALCVYAGTSISRPGLHDDQSSTLDSALAAHRPSGATEQPGTAFSIT